jgi:hypothetical protein
VFERFGDLPSSPLLSMKIFEVIVHYIGCERLYVSRDRLRMLRRKDMQRLASTGTKLEVSLLNQVVNNVAPTFAPLMRCSDHGETNCSMEAGDELFPSPSII